MATKAAYDRSVRKAFRTQLNSICLRVGVDLSIVPHMLTYPKQLTRAWEPKEPSYEEDEEEDDKDADE